MCGYRIEWNEDGQNKEVIMDNYEETMKYAECLEKKYGHVEVTKCYSW